MKIRHGLVLAMTIGLGLVGCASGGGGGSQGGGGLEAILARAGGEDAGEPVRETPNTEAAEQALDAAEAAAENGDTQQARTQYEQALAAAEAAIREDSTNPLAHRLAGRAALGLEDYQTAGDHLDRAIELRPIYELDLVDLREQTWIDLYQEGSPHVQAADYETAVEYFEDADAIFKGRPEAMITLGQLHAQLRNHDEALESIDDAIAFGESERMEVADSTTAADWRDQIGQLAFLRAQVLADAGRFEEAATAYRELSEEDPANVELKRGLAAILMELGREDEAFALYDELLTMPGLSAADMFSIGVGFYQGEDYGRAAEAFGAAAEESVNDRDSLEMWARSLQLDSAFAEVEPVVDRWIELDPNSRNAWLILAQAANQVDDQETTREAVAAAEGLEVAVQDLQLTRFGGGGASVTGSLINLMRQPGTSVTMQFTFYDAAGTPLGNVTETFQLDQQDMAEIIQLEFDSAERVDGYGYQLTID